MRCPPEGWKAGDVANALLINTDTARTYFKRYKKGGLDALLRINYVGSEALLDDAQKEFLEKYGYLKKNSAAEDVILIERFWKFFKRQVLYNSYYEAFDDYKNACQQFFTGPRFLCNGTAFVVDGKFRDHRCLKNRNPVFTGYTSSLDTVLLYLRRAPPVLSIGPA